jgi:hypothetical protein
MYKKAILIPYFGQFPEWHQRFLNQLPNNSKNGFEWFIFTDKERFYRLVEGALGITPNIITGTQKVQDFRPAFGLIFKELLAGYDFWGHSDLDCVYGNLGNFVTDKLLSGCDIFSNDPGTICGPFTLYRNCPEVNTLFMRDDWETVFTTDRISAFEEQKFSETVNQSTLRKEYRFWQGKDANDDSHLHMIGDKLYDGDDEIMMFHFNRLKRWPL